MLLSLLSGRLRTWLLVAVVAPVVAGALEEAGERLAPRNPALGSALQRAGRIARVTSPGRRAAGRARAR